MVAKKKSKKATAAQLCSFCNGTGDNRKIPHPLNVAWNRVTYGCKKCGGTGHKSISYTTYDHTVVVDDLRRYAQYIRTQLAAPNIINAEMIERAANIIENQDENLAEMEWSNE